MTPFDDLDDLDALSRALRRELTGGILPYWQTRTVDHARGGFYGRIDGEGQIVPEAPKGAVLNARLLWAFAAAARVLGDASCRSLAERADAYLKTHFWDEEHGGVFWMLHADGTPAETKKQVYAQAFAAYAFAEYYRLTEDDESRQCAVRLFEYVEEHAFDAENGGYVEAFARDGQPLDDVRLSEKDANEKKTMNTHLHVLEAYANLYRVWPDATLAGQLRRLVRRFLDTIVNGATHHLVSFFDEHWTPRSDFVSYGHDIEASWLLVEAAEVLGDDALLQETQATALRIARAVRDEGQDADGGLFYERCSDGTLDDDKHCWPQAEALVGFVNAHALSGERAFLDAALACWEFTRTHVIDGDRGEWFFRVSRAGAPYRSENKVGPWKGPYHNTRACLEVMRRAEEGRRVPENQPAEASYEAS